MGRGKGEGRAYDWGIAKVLGEEFNVGGGWGGHFDGWWWWCIWW